MRALFSVLGLLLVVLVVGMLAKKQLTTAAAPVTPAAVSTGQAAPASGAPQQQVEQFQRAVQESMQAPRPEPDTK